MRIAVNTISTKKQSGGALQIAYNFLLETLKHDAIEWYYLTSADVDELVGDEFKNILGSRYFVFPTQPDFMGSYMRVKKELGKWEEQHRPDVIYTISSPCYFSFSSKEVLRFANAWVTNPNKYAWRALPLMEWFRMKLYRINQLRLLHKAKYVVTQSEVVGRGLKKQLGLSDNNVKVVSNVLPRVFQSVKVCKQCDDKFIDIACVAAPFPHKNLVIIPKVLRVLKEEYGFDNIRFHLTIPEDDPILQKIVSECSLFGLGGSIVNHGRCPQKQLVEIYNRCLLCFLPSLLETFSATSLEAMYFQLPVVATNFDFNHEILGDSCLYYDPLDAEEAATQIKRIVEEECLRNELKRKMENRLVQYSDYGKHFNDILAFLIKVGEKRG